MAMARSDERTPLLVDVESLDSYDLKPFSILSPELSPESGNKKLTDQDESKEDFKLVAVFVVTFDTKHGKLSCITPGICLGARSWDSLNAQQSLILLRWYISPFPLFVLKVTFHFS